MSPVQVGAWIYLPPPGSAPYSAANVQLQADKQQPTSSLHQPTRTQTSPGGSHDGGRMSAKARIAVGEAYKLLMGLPALQLPFLLCSNWLAHPTPPCSPTPPTHSFTRTVTLSVWLSPSSSRLTITVSAVLQPHTGWPSCKQTLFSF